jgi:hypothetical protein
MIVEAVTADPQAPGQPAQMAENFRKPVTEH